MIRLCTEYDVLSFAHSRNIEGSHDFKKGHVTQAALLATVPTVVKQRFTISGVVADRREAQHIIRPLMR